MSYTHWLGHQVELACSSGGVLAFVDPWEGVVRGDVSPWPPPELTQKLYKSRQSRAFRGPEASKATESLGFYSDLQSVHSEDAVTWSLFGPLAYAPATVRIAFTKQLFEELKIPGTVSRSTIWLWRRLPHPDSLVSGGPEIDVGVQTESTLILGEAKWRSGVGQAQGVGKDKDQIQLRAEFCTKYGGKIYPEIRQFVVLGIGRSMGLLSPEQLAHSDGCVSVRETTWERLGLLDSNPYAEEFRSQLGWRTAHSQVLHSPSE